MMSAGLAELFLAQLKTVFELKTAAAAAAAAVAVATKSVKSDWHSRLAALTLLQNYGTFNLFLLNVELKRDIERIVTGLLGEEQLEVRSLASGVLAGFIHSNLVDVNDELIVRFVHFCCVYFLCFCKFNFVFCCIRII